MQSNLNQIHFTILKKLLGYIRLYSAHSILSFKFIYNVYKNYILNKVQFLPK